MRPRLLIVSFQQYGRHVATMRMSQILGRTFAVTHLCVDQGFAHEPAPELEVVYAARRPLGSVDLGLFLAAARLLRRRRYAAVYWRNTKLAFLIRLLFPRPRMVLDIRSGSVHPSAAQRRRENRWIRWNALFFRRVAVISEPLGRQLGIAPRRLHEVGLASDPRPLRRRRADDELRLLYVGTLHHRGMERTVAGLALFLRAHPRPCRYTMLVFGSAVELQALHAAVAAAGLGDVVRVLPRVPHDELDDHLLEHDVGIAFAPRLPCYEHQPFTKLYEYLHAGLACIAVDTPENRKLVHGGNGELTDDTAAGFAAALERLVPRLPQLDPEAIQGAVRHLTWEQLVSDRVVPLLAPGASGGRPH